MQQRQVINIFKAFKSANPKPKTELEYNNEFTLLVAIVLSAQATDVSVNKATQALFKEYDTAQKLLTLGELGLKSYIKTIGLYNAKAKNIIKLCRQLLDEHNGTIPHDLDKLQSLAGVGRKTANVFLNCAKSEPTIAVDTHVFRVANRIGLVKTKTPLATEKALIKTVPDEFKLHAHHWLILHGRYICKARKPLCAQCKISEFCHFYLKAAAKLKTA
jgi:endonuclease III